MNSWTLYTFGTFPVSLHFCIPATQFPRGWTAVYVASTMGSADSARCGKRDCPQYQRDTTRRLFGRVKSLNSQRSFLNSLQLETTLGDLLLVNLTGPQDGFGDKSFNRISLVIVKMNYMGWALGRHTYSGMRNIHPEWTLGHGLRNRYKPRCFS